MDCPFKIGAEIMDNKKVFYVSIICLIIGLILTTVQVVNYVTYDTVDAKVVDFIVHKSARNKRGANYEVLEYEYKSETYTSERKVVFRSNSKDVGTTKSIKINPKNPEKIFNHTYWVVFFALDVTAILFIFFSKKGLQKTVD